MSSAWFLWTFPLQNGTHSCFRSSVGRLLRTISKHKCAPLSAFPRPASRSSWCVFRKVGSLFERIYRSIDTFSFQVAPWPNYLGCSPGCVFAFLYAIVFDCLSLHSHVPVSVSKRILSLHIKHFYVGGLNPIDLSISQVQQKGLKSSRSRCSCPTLWMDLAK